MALGTLASGFSDWSPGVTSGVPPSSEVSVAFTSASEAVLLALEALKGSSEIRTAARHAFSRLLGPLSANVLPQLPRWIEGLLSSASSNDEMAMFLRTLAHVVYGFKTEIYSILDTLITPLLQRVFTGLSLQVSGTDDEIQLKELKQQYLNLILVILNNDLGSVLVSPTNQATFDAFVDSLKRFAVDISDLQSARLAFSTLTHMTAVWGGPDIPAGSSVAPAPDLPGFDSFFLAQFAPLPWTLIAQPGFTAGDALMRGALHEGATLQWTILRKTGDVYRRQLRQELQSLGAGEDGIDEFMRNIGKDVVVFRKFLSGFVQGGKR